MSTGEFTKEHKEGVPEPRCQLIRNQGEGMESCSSDDFSQLVNANGGLAPERRKFQAGPSYSERTEITRSTRKEWRSRASS